MSQDVIHIAANADDQHVEQSSLTYPPSTSFLRQSTGTTQLSYNGFFTDNRYYIDVGLIRFDSSIIPDTDRIDSAKVTLWITAVQNANLRSLSMGYAPWDGVSNSDWTGLALTDAHAGTLLSNITAGADNDFALLNPDTSINKIGYTYFKLTIKGGQPTGENSITFACLEHATLPEARLTINHSATDTTAPANPTGLAATVLGG